MKLLFPPTLEYSKIFSQKKIRRFCTTSSEPNAHFCTLVRFDSYQLISSNPWAYRSVSLETETMELAGSRQGASIFQLPSIPPFRSQHRSLGYARAWRRHHQDVASSFPNREQCFNCVSVGLVVFAACLVSDALLVFFPKGSPTIPFNLPTY